MKTAHHLGQNLGDHLLLHSQHKTKQCAVIGHSLQFQRLSQLSVFGQAVAVGVGVGVKVAVGVGVGV